MALTATELTIEHYQRPEVKEIITKFGLLQDGTWRALNGDFRRWYEYNDNDVRLLNAKEDYDHLTAQFRVLYQTLNVFDPSLWMVLRPKEEITPENPLGTPADTIAYSLGVDIDKGRDCTLEDPEIKTAVEDAAKFLVDSLKAHGIHQSIWVLFSGGGIYVKVHHEIVKPKTKESRAEFFELVTDRYNRFIGHISEEFFKAHPEHIGKVKYDALNNAKRIFKSILSIHKSKPYAVTPLSRDDIKIDFERARIPLKDDMIAEAKVWYSSYDLLEREPLFELLDEFEPIVKDEKRQKQRFAEIWRSEEKVSAEHFPPCIKYMVESDHSGGGKNRISAILSTYLYQLGWDEDEAFELVDQVSRRNGIGNFEHIFDSCYGHLSCPSCATIQNDGTGYPHLGLKGLGICQPDEGCSKWPGDYGTKTGPTVVDAIKLLASVCDGARTKDRQGFNSWDLRKKGDLINKAISSGNLSQVEESKLYKLCYKYRKQLDKLGVPYAEIEPIRRKKRNTEYVNVGESASLTRDDVIEFYEVGDVVKERFSPTKTVEAILTKLPVVMGEDGLLYYCHEDIWAPNALPVISQTLQDLAEDHYSDVYSLKEVKLRLEHKLEFERVKMDGDPYLLGVQNGVVDLRTGEIRDYDPDDYITIQIPVTFDPRAKCPAFMGFLGSITNVKIDRLTLIDWIAIHAIRKAFPFILFLLGLGRNGKRIYEYVLESFYGGPLRFSHMGLGDTSKSNFAASALMGKVGRIVAEAGDDKPGKKVISTGFLKKCTGDDIIESDRKNTTHVQFCPTFKTTIDCNDMPLITDMSVGWAERFVKISLPFTFVADPDPKNPIQRMKDPHLKAKLTTPEEMSGILNLVLERTKEICKTEEIIRRPSKEMSSEYAVQSNSVKSFLDLFCDYEWKNSDDYDDEVPLEYVYECYARWCDYMVADKVDDKRFGGSVGKFCNGTGKKRKHATARQSEQYKLNPPRKRISMYMGFLFYEDSYIAAMESLTTSMDQEKMASGDNPVPLCPIDVPLKSGNSPNDPLNQENMYYMENIWDNLKKENDNIFFYREELDFRGFDGTSGQHNDSDRPSKNINGTDSDINGTNKQKPTSSASAKNEIKTINGTDIDQLSKINSYEINAAPEEENASAKKVRWTEEEEPPSKPCGSCDVAIKGDKKAIECENCSFLSKEPETDTLEVYFLKDQVEPWQGINIPRRVLHEAGTTAVLPVAEARALIQAGIALLAVVEV